MQSLLQPEPLACSWSCVGSETNDFIVVKPGLAAASLSRSLVECTTGRTNRVWDIGSGALSWSLHSFAKSVFGLRSFAQT